MDVLALGLVGDGALRAAVAADREVTRMEGARLDHLAAYLTEVAQAYVRPPVVLRGEEQLLQLGGVGTPRVREFTVCEVAGALGLSQPAATGLCADVLDLSVRLPQVAECVREGSLPFVRARMIARRTRDLTVAECGLVQARLMQTRDTGRGPIPVAALVPMGRLKHLVDQAVLTVRGPETVEQAEAAVAASLYVEVVHQAGGATDVAARLATADAARLDARLEEIAGWLTDIGDARPKKILRAVALGLLADPDLLTALSQIREQSRSGAAGQTTDDAPAAPADPLAPVAPVAAPSALALPDDAVAPPDAAPAEPVEAEMLFASEPAPAVPAQPDSSVGHADDGVAVHGGDASHCDEGGSALGPSSGVTDAETMSQAPATGAPSGAIAGVTASPSAAAPAAGIAGLPAGVLEKLAKSRSTVLYLHLDRASGTWCEEGAGVLSKEQARQIVGHSQVTIRPVLDLAEPLTYTGYVAPPKLKRQLALLNSGYCTFPHCHRRAVVSDVDHQHPYADGGPTTSGNTHRLCRKHHRAKDKGRWRVVTPAPGIWIWSSPAGAVWLVSNGTTTPLNGIFTAPAVRTLGEPGPQADGDETPNGGGDDTPHGGGSPSSGGTPNGGRTPDGGGDADGGHTPRNGGHGPGTEPPRWPGTGEPVGPKDTDTPTGYPMTAEEYDVTYGYVDTG